MPRAEVGSTKYIANQMKSKGLQRLRWYCQACQRQMRDENGFKCHVASESHVRNMQVIGEDPRKAINDFSRQFERDFLQLLRTGHGEKKVNLNHFYQEYIANKEHIHMNATKWPSLTEFAKHLGREGICRVEEDSSRNNNDDGGGGGGGRGGASALTVAWIDNSPEALRRQEAIRRKERQDKGDEEREQKMIQEQIRRARRAGLDGDGDGDGSADSDNNGDDDGRNEQAQGIRRKNGEKVVLSFGKKPAEPGKPPTPPSPPSTGGDKSASPPGHESESVSEAVVQGDKADSGAVPNSASLLPSSAAAAAAAPPPPPPPPPPATTKAVVVAGKPGGFQSLSIISASKPKNVFAAVSNKKKNALGGGSKKANPLASAKPMSEAERIMKEELERKRRRESEGVGAPKKQRLS